MTVTLRLENVAKLITKSPQKCWDAKTRVILPRNDWEGDAPERNDAFEGARRSVWTAEGVRLFLKRLALKQ